MCGSLSFILSFVHDRFIRQKYMIFFYLFSLLCTTIRPKIRVLIDLFFLFVHDHSTKVRGHSYSVIYSFLNCANISFAIFITDCPYISYALFLAVVPLYFVRYIHSSQSINQPMSDIKENPLAYSTVNSKRSRSFLLPQCV